MQQSARIVLNGFFFNREQFDSLKDFYTVAVDGGINYLNESDKIDLHIGDMDSSHKKVNSEKQILLPKEKDYSDLHFALEHLIKKNIKRVAIFASKGGRCDHFIANIQTSVFFASQQLEIIHITDNEIIYISPFPLKLSLEINQTISIFAGSEEIKNLTLSGFKYELQNTNLKRNIPLGLSNQVVDETCSITFDQGVIIVTVNMN